MLIFVMEQSTTIGAESVDEEGQSSDSDDETGENKIINLYLFVILSLSFHRGVSTSDNSAPPLPWWAGCVCGPRPVLEGGGEHSPGIRSRGVSLPTGPWQALQPTVCS